MMDIGAVRFDADGLIPGVVQDERTRSVLMVGWLDETALRATLQSGLVHFWSRSRQTLWQKGETSGNRLHVSDVRVDCDADTLLITARPDGPTCHRNTTSCFEPTGDVAADQGFAWLEQLWRVVASRAADRPAGSYTTELLAGGPEVAGRKVLEEAGEVLVAGMQDAMAPDTETRLRVAEEAADLLYHLLVLLAERTIAPAEMLDVLAGRHRPR